MDACGLPIKFEITGGQVNDCTQASSLISKLPAADTLVADKGYDSEKIREQIELQGAKAVIPRKRDSVKGNADLDLGIYRNRHLVENAFARLKHYRAVASRFDKLKRNYESVVAMACAFLWLLQYTGIPVGVGIAHTKTLVKLANHTAKRLQAQTGGVVNITDLVKRAGYCVTPTFRRCGVSSRPRLAMQESACLHPNGHVQSG